MKERVKNNTQPSPKLWLKKRSAHDTYYSTYSMLGNLALEVRIKNFFFIFRKMRLAPAIAVSKVNFPH